MKPRQQRTDIERAFAQLPKSASNRLLDGVHSIPDRSSFEVEFRSRQRHQTTRAYSSGSIVSAPCPGARAFAAHFPALQHFTTNEPCTLRERASKSTK